MGTVSITTVIKYLPSCKPHAVVLKSDPGKAPELRGVTGEGSVELGHDQGSSNTRLFRLQGERSSAPGPGSCVPRAPFCYFEVRIAL